MIMILPIFLDNFGMPELVLLLALPLLGLYVILCIIRSVFRKGEPKKRSGGCLIALLLIAAILFGYYYLGNEPAEGETDTTGEVVEGTPADDGPDADIKYEEIEMAVKITKTIDTHEGIALKQTEEGLYLGDEVIVRLPGEVVFDGKEIAAQPYVLVGARKEQGKTLPIYLEKSAYLKKKNNK